MEDCIYIVQSGELNLYLLDKVGFFETVYICSIIHGSHQDIYLLLDYETRDFTENCDSVITY